MPQKNWTNLIARNKKFMIWILLVLLNVLPIAFHNNTFKSSQLSGNRNSKSSLSISDIGKVFRIPF